MPFEDPILANNTLIRAAIQSPNYIAATSGWTVNQDGSAEFNNVDVRGDLSGSVITIPSGATITQRIVIDQFGIHIYDNTNTLVANLVPGSIQTENLFGMGAGDFVNWRIGGGILGKLSLTAPEKTIASNGLGFIQLLSDNVNASGNAALDGLVTYIASVIAPNLTANAELKIFNALLNGDGNMLAVEIVETHSPGAARKRVDICFGDQSTDGTYTNGVVAVQRTATDYHTVTAPDRMKFGGSPRGAYYAEEFACGALVVATGVTTALASGAFPLTVTKSHSDYGTSVGGAGPMNLTTASWTCPEDGYWDITAGNAYAGGAAGSRIGLYCQRNANTGNDPLLVNDFQDGSGRGRVTIGGTRWLNAGDVLHFNCVQATGANQTYRVGDGSFITIAKRL